MIRGRPGRFGVNVHFRAISGRCHRRIVSGVTIVATCRKTRRPSRRPFVARRRRWSSVSRRRRPFSWSVRTRFSSTRYSMTCCCRQLTHPASVTSSTCRLALQSTKRHGRWRAGICPTRHAGHAGSEAGTLWQVPACTISCLRTGRGVAPTGRYSTSVRRKRTTSSIRLGDSTPSASAVNVEIGDPPLPMPVGGPPDPASVG
jgi:hypothetical protein